MQSLVERDYFTDHEILKDPYAFFNALREFGPVYQPPGKDYYIVTGFEEALEVLRNHDTFSAAISLQGAGTALPFTPEGSDINPQIEEHRRQFAGWDQVVNMDDDRHTKLRALINTLFVPSRLKASEEFIDKYCEEMVGKAVADGKVELIDTIATPFVTMVVADLLGVPMEDRNIFMDAIAAAPPPGSLDGHDPMDPATSPFAVMGKYFYRYIADRRANPRDDILTEFAFAKYLDGTTPEVYDLVQLGMFMFGAGQDTSAKLLGNAMRYLTENPEMQRKLRNDPSQIGAFLEETLRLEGSTKTTFRLARRTTTVGGYEIKAGTKIVIAFAAANRDPRRWENPQDFVFDRPRINQHLAFGRGLHTCIGAPLARAEVRVLLEKFLEHTSDITLSPRHGKPGAADLRYEPSYIIRGLEDLHIELKPR